MQHHRAHRYAKGTWMRLTSPATLRALMGQRGFSNSRTARYSGCSPSFIAHLLVGRKTTCTPALAQRIAEALDVPLDILFVPTVSTPRGHVDNRVRVA